MLYIRPHSSSGVCSKTQLCATSTGGSTPSQSLLWSPYHTLTPCSSRRGGAPFSQRSISRESDRWKTSFLSQLRQFQWKVVPFGLQGSSSVLMRVMNEAMTKDQKGNSSLHGKGGVPGATGPLYRCVVVYMDDLLIYSPTLEQHVKDVDEVLAILGERKLFAKAPTCELGRQELGFLGQRVSAEGIKVDQRKVQAIREWQVQSSCAEVRRFCGLANYYRRFVPPYVEVAAPLTALCSPAARWHWGMQEATSFMALQELLLVEPVLSTFNQTWRPWVTTEASQTAIAATLTLEDAKGNHQPVTF